MSFPEIIGLLGILIAFFVVIFFTYKGFHLAYVVMVACIIVLVTNNMPLMESFSQTIMPKVGEQAATLLPLYLFGAISVSYTQLDVYKRQGDERVGGSEKVLC